MNALAKTAPAPAESLAVRPLQPSIGAEISGLDLREPLSEQQRDEIRSALLRYKVVFFRDQQIDAEQQAAFARNFGPLYTHPTTKQPSGAIPALHNIAAEDFKLYEAEYRKRTEEWDAYHTDTSWRLVPTWGAVLRAVTLPETGGDTIWVSGSLAYEGLSDVLKQQLEGLHVTHDFRSSLLKSGNDYPIVAHPIVRTHRETGEKILWVNFSQHPQIIGLDRAEGKAILTAILDQYRRPEHQVRFSWREGSIAFWDNRAAVHYAVRNYGDFPRVLHRILIEDEPLYASL